MTPNFLKEIRSTADFARTMLFSSTRSQREELFERVREAGRTYRPILEQELGVELGETKPRTYLERPFWATKKFAESSINKINKSNLKTDEKAVIYGILAPICLMGFPILFFAHLYRENNTFMAHGEEAGVIYISDGQCTRLGLYLERNYSKIFPVEEMVVPEMGHEIWQKISGVCCWEVPRTLFEGFSCYLQKDLMRGLYPYDEAKYGAKLSSKVYAPGLEKVRKVIQERGRSFLREIPKKWRELETN